MLDISYNVVHPSQFSQLLIDCREHTEAQSLAPGWNALQRLTKSLANSGVSAKKKIENGRKVMKLAFWNFKTTEYERSRKVIASGDILS